MVTKVFGQRSWFVLPTTWKCCFHSTVKFNDQIAGFFLNPTCSVGWLATFWDYGFVLPTALLMVGLSGILGDASHFPSLTGDPQHFKLQSIRTMVLLGILQKIASEYPCGKWYFSWKRGTNTKNIQNQLTFWVEDLLKSPFVSFSVLFLSLPLWHWRNGPPTQLQSQMKVYRNSLQLIE